MSGVREVVRVARALIGRFRLTPLLESLEKRFQELCDDDRWFHGRVLGCSVVLVLAGARPAAALSCAQHLGCDAALIAAGSGRHRTDNVAALLGPGA